MKPTVGRIVHFIDGDDRLAAIVTLVHNDTCINLAVFDRGGVGTFGRTSCCLGTSDGCWCWPVIQQAAQTPSV